MVDRSVGPLDSLGMVAIMFWTGGYGFKGIINIPCCCCCCWFVPYIRRFWISSNGSVNDDILDDASFPDDDRLLILLLLLLWLSFLTWPLSRSLFASMGGALDPNPATAPPPVLRCLLWLLLALITKGIFNRPPFDLAETARTFSHQFLVVVTAAVALVVVEVVLLAWVVASIVLV
jgi:hypothetical protein